MTFVPFHEGLLDYDCQHCGAGCCQSGNIVANKGEKNTLLQENPFVLYFFAGKENGTYTFHKHPQCWFLESDGLCKIQKKHGYALKPFICRIHPFYIAECVGDFVVIPSGCEALRVTPHGQQSHISHESILANAQEAVDCGYFSDEIDWSPARMDLERTVLHESGALLDKASYVDFAALQIAVTKPDRNLTDIQVQLSTTVNFWKAFLNLEDLLIESREVTYELTAITSLLRVSHLSLRNMPVDQVPVALLALYLYMILFSQGARAKRFVGTYESVLSDIPLGLVYLTKEDLRIKGQPLEKKLLYLQTLRRIQAPGFLKTLKPKKQADKK